MDGDQSLAGLFTDSDSTGFLDELTDSDIVLGGTGGLGDLASGMNPYGMSSQPAQQQSQQSFMGALGNQSQMQQQQQQSQYGASDFNQFGSPKAFMNDASNPMSGMGMQPRMMSPSSQPHMMSPSPQQPQMLSQSPQPGMMSPSPRIMSPSPQQQQNQYSSPPSNSHMPTPGYGQYPVHSSPRMTPPRPGSVPMMNQAGMWPQGQAGPSYMPGQGPSQHQPTPSYMGQQRIYHDYPNQPNQQQYASYDQQTAGQYPNQMNSPPANPASHHLSRMGQMQAASNTMGMNPSQRMMSYPQQNPMVRQNFPDSSPMQTSQSLSSGHLNSSNIPQYPPYQQQQQQSMAGRMMQPDAPPLSHYPQSSSNQSSYHQGYSAMGGQPRAPFPTPPTSQGNYPSGMGMDRQFMSSSASQFPPQQQPNVYSSVSMTQNTNTHGQYSNASALHNGTPMSSNGPVNSSMMGGARPMANTSMATSMTGPMVKTSMSSGMSRMPAPGPMSPSVSVNNPQALNMEINQLQQQVNQLYNMPQAPQTQQKMLDVQERLRSLKAQQQQLLMQQQRLQQQPPGVMHPQMTPGMTPQQQQPQGMTQQQPMLRPGMGQQPPMSAQQQQQHPGMPAGPQMQPKPGMGPQSGPPSMGPSPGPGMGPQTSMNQQGQIPPNMNPQVTQNMNQNMPQSSLSQQPGVSQHTPGIRPPPGMMTQMNQSRPPMGPGNSTGMLMPHRPQQQPSPRPQGHQGPIQGAPSPAMPMSPMAAMSPMAVMAHRMPVPQQQPPQQLSQQPQQSPMMQPIPHTQLQQPMPGQGPPLMPGQPPINQDGIPASTPPLNGLTPNTGVPNTNGPGSTMVSLLGGGPLPQANGEGQSIPSTISDGAVGEEPAPRTTKKRSKKRPPKSEKAQEKANKIISEAVAKAQAEGKTIPKVVDTENLDGSEQGADGEDDKKKKSKKPRTPRPKKDKAEKDKEKAERDKDKAEKAAARAAAKEAAKEERAKAAAEKKLKFVPKPKSSKKKKPPATFLKSKKRKRKNSDDGSDVEVKIEEPYSGKEDDDDFSNKRRSARNTKRKKYLDDIDLNLSEDENALKLPEEGDHGAVIKPENVFAPEEDVLIVEKILGSRIGKRAIPKIKEVEATEDAVVDVEGTPVKTDETKTKSEDAENADSATETEDNVEQMQDGDDDDEKTKEKSAEKREERSSSEDDQDKLVIDTGADADANTSDAAEARESDAAKDEDAKDAESDENSDDAAPGKVEKEDVESSDKKTEEMMEVDDAKTKEESNKEEQKDKKEEPTKEEDFDYVEVEEFYVRYKNFSYLHCEWRTEDELLLGDKRVAQKLKRYRMKKLQMNSYFQELDEEELFNPDYVEVDRVLAESKVTDPNTGEETRHYLVKWRALPYEESTWEMEADVDDAKIECFRRFEEPPPEEERVERARPGAKEWEKVEEHRTYKNNNRLREYQLEGVNWMTFCYYKKQNCILADEMGLGKTVQSITFIQEVISYGIRGPFLVIVPLSTVGNWQREFETWTDINCIVYHGSTPSRNMVQEYEMYYKDEDGNRIPDCYKFQALITTYEMIISDLELFSSIEWRLLIIDEAHRLKNTKCKLIEGLRCVEIEHKVLLTGTPLQNNIDELFSLLNFLEPKQFTSSEAFLADFGELKSETQVDKLKAILKPMMLRRLKEDVEKNLAAKEETIVEVELTNIQKKYYRAILERNFTFLAKGGSNANMPNLMNTVMELRKCCNHPYLVQGAEEKILDEWRERKQAMDAENVMQAMIQSSGKLVLVDKLLPKLKAGNHKVLIFSQMIRVLDILEDYLISNHYLYERLDGRIRGNIRQEAIDRFSKPDSDRFVFLLCTRAGGLGINLTAADTVIIYDSDWNPQNDLQAQARCHRIGQTKEVKVYRLITRNTYEREMFDRASLKLGLDKAVLQSMGGKEMKDTQQLSKKEVEELLKKGAYGALMDDDNQGDQFCEEDIDQILKRRTQVITLESGEKGSTFAKASFSMTENSTDISVDDPEFWQKWAKKAELDMDEINNRDNLIIEMPRRRKQTARYGNQDMMELSEVEDAEYDSEDEDDETQRGRTKKGMRPGSARKGRRNRGDDFYDPDEDLGGLYGRSEMFKVEKNVLVYGWGRWEAVLSHARFKKKMTEEDVSTISRAMLLYSLIHYKGDDRIKQFILDLTTSKQGGEEFKNHSGLSAPVPRGRKGKKKQKDPKAQSAIEQEIAKCGFDPESILVDEGYKRHLQRHSNKVLLRVRLLYYIRQEVIGDQAEKVFQNLPYNQIDIPHPYCDGDPPVFWWDEDADRSLLVGIFKHGYEKYNTMRQDPALCFLQRCGPPDSKAVAAEMNDDGDGLGGDADEEGKDKDDDEDELMDDASRASTPSKKSVEPVGDINAEMGKLAFPGTADLNARLRRLITSYQRNHKRNIVKQEQYAKRMERRERFEAEIHEREIRKRVQQQRWSRREETDFYKTVSSFGIERERGSKKFVWTTFRQMAHLEKKYDQTLTEYFLAFQHMCLLVCKRFKTEEESMPPNSLMVEPLTEERAGRCLAKVDLLMKVREEILWHPKLQERLKLCQASPELPEWWEPGTHDKELLIGAAKHGVARTDMHILHDPKLIFKEVLTKFMLNLANKAVNSMKTETKDETVIKEEKPEIVKKEGEKEEEAVKEEGKKDVKEEQLENGEVKEDEDDEKEEGEDEKKEAKKEESVKKELKDEDVEMKEENEDVKEEKMEVDVKKKDVKKEQNVVKEEEKEEEESDKNETSNDEKEENGPLSSDEKMPELAKEEEDKKMDDKELNEKKMPKLEESVPPTLEENPLSVLQRNINKLSDPEGRANTPSTPGAEDTDDTIDTKANDPFGASPVHWPKDKVLFKRLEQICYCIEKGEWCAKKFTKLADSQPDSRSSTPSSTPKPDNDYVLNTTEAQARLYQVALARSRGVDYSRGCDFLRGSDFSDLDEEGYQRTSWAEGDTGLKMTFHKKRRRRTKAEMEADRIRAMNEIMGASSDADSMSESSFMNGNADSPMHVPKPEDEWSLSGMSTPGSERKDGMFSAKKRGRKRKIDKLLEAAAEAAAQGNQSLAAANMSAAEMLAAVKKQPLFASPSGYSSLVASQNVSTSPPSNRTQPSTPVSGSSSAPDSDVRVPVINLEDGSRLKGEGAPRRSELVAWLKEHPGYIMEPPEPEEDEREVAMELNMALEGKRRRRKVRLDPNTIDIENLQGDENVSVMNRDTGKKITGAKAPPLRYLAEWLDKNPEYDVEAKWSPIVSAWGTLPDRLHKRLLKPSGRGRKPNSVLNATRSPQDLYAAAAGLNSYASLASAGLLSGFPKLPMGFGGMPGLGFNPMYAASLAGFGMMGGLKTEEEEEEKPKSKTKEKTKEKASSSSPAKSKSSSGSAKSPSTSSASSLTPHPSFPLMYNPMMFMNNPLFAQSLAGFTLPSGLPTSFASLANQQSKLLNGAADSDEEPQPPPSKHSKSSDRTKSSSKDSRNSSRHLSAKEILAKDLSAKHYAKDLSAKNLSSKSSGSLPKDLSGKDLSSLSHSRSHSSASPQDLSVKRKTKDYHSLHHTSSRSHPDEAQDLSAPVDFSKKSSKSALPSSATSSSLLSSLSQIGKKKETNEQPMDLVKKDKPKKGLGDIIGKLKAVKEKEILDKPKPIAAPAGRSLLKTETTSKEGPSSSEKSDKSLTPKSSKDAASKDSSPPKEKNSPPKQSDSPPKKSSTESMSSESEDKES